MNAFYKWNKTKLVENFTYIKQTFSSKYDNFSLSYSFKTNCEEKILKSILELEGFAEVVSPFEYEIAKKIGFSIDKIIYNGVIKNEKTFLECSLLNGKVNLDNKEELKIAIDYYETTKIALKIGVRLNFDIQNGIKSRFGIDVESELFNKIVESEKQGKIIVSGLHCHFTQAKEIETWKNRANQMKKYASFFKNLEYLDFGGNMYSLSEKNLMIQYSDILCECIKEINKEREKLFNSTKKLELIIESGTPLISDAVDLISEVTHIKNGFIFLNCSKFDLGIHAQNDKCKIIVERNPLIEDSQRRKIQNAKLVGYTCMENDVLKKSFSGFLTIGDKVIFKNIGDYSICWANNFICPTLEFME